LSGLVTWLIGNGAVLASLQRVVNWTETGQQPMDI
jgi:hypothetical protein